MKKLSILVALLLCCGCARIGTSNNDTEQQDEAKDVIVNCSKEDGSTTTFFSKDDEIYSMQQIFYSSFESLGIPDGTDAETIVATVNDSMAKKYADVAGVSTTSEIDDNRVKVTIMIDFDVADLNQLIELGLLDEGSLESQYISLDKTRSTYQNSGYACEVQ